MNNKQLKKLSSDDLQKNFRLFLSGYEIIDCGRNADGTIWFSILRKGKPFLITVYLKNICECGWSDKTNIKRIQIKPLNSIHRTEKNRCFLLAGITVIKNKIILVVWGDPLKYIYHQTNRSAYVKEDLILDTFDIGFQKNIVKSELRYACDNEHFQELLEAYISDSFVERIEW